MDHFSSFYGVWGGRGSGCVRRVMEASQGEQRQKSLLFTGIILDRRINARAMCVWNMFRLAEWFFCWITNAMPLCCHRRQPHDYRLVRRERTQKICSTIEKHERKMILSPNFLFITWHNENRCSFLLLYSGKVILVTWHRHNRPRMIICHRYSSNWWQTTSELINFPKELQSRIAGARKEN